MFLQSRAHAYLGALHSDLPGVAPRGLGKECTALVCVACTDGHLRDHDIPCARLVSWRAVMSPITPPVSWFCLPHTHNNSLLLSISDIEHFLNNFYRAHCMLQSVLHTFFFLLFTINA